MLPHSRDARRNSCFQRRATTGIGSTSMMWCFPQSQSPNRPLSGSPALEFWCCCLSEEGTEQIPSSEPPHRSFVPAHAPQCGYGGQVGTVVHLYPSIAEP